MFNNNKILQELRMLFGEKSSQVYLVGGAVRDILLDKPPKDIDLVTTLSINELYEMGARYIDPKTAIPVFSLRHPKLGKMDIALPRIERKMGERHQDFSFYFGDHITLEMDLQRRDFTINSMALGLDGMLYDPFNGKIDLEDRVLRHTGEAFSEDSLRVFRALRFTAKGYILTQELKNLLQTIDIAALPVERIYNEMISAMKEVCPERFFLNMIELGIAKDLFKEVHQMRNLPAGPKEYHPEADLLVHSVNALVTTSKDTMDPTARLASFLHDLGKVDTDVTLLPQHKGHETSDAVERLLIRLKVDNHVKKVTVSVAQNHMRYAKLVEMKHPGKQLKITYTLMTDNALEAMFHLSKSDDPKSYLETATIANDAKTVLSMNVFQLGLDVEELRNRPGEVVKQVVLQKRIGKFMELKRGK